MKIEFEHKIHYRGNYNRLSIFLMNSSSGAKAIVPPIMFVLRGIVGGTINEVRYRETFARGHKFY